MSASRQPPPPPPPTSGEDFILLDARLLRPALEFLRPKRDQDAAIVMLLLIGATYGRELDVGEHAQALGFTDHQYHRALERLGRSGVIEAREDLDGRWTIKARPELRL